MLQCFLAEWAAPASTCCDPVVHAAKTHAVVTYGDLPGPFGQGLTNRNVLIWWTQLRVTTDCTDLRFRLRRGLGYGWFHDLFLRFLFLWFQGVSFAGFRECSWL